MIFDDYVAKQSFDVVDVALRVLLETHWFNFPLIFVILRISPPAVWLPMLNAVTPLPALAFWARWVLALCDSRISAVWLMPHNVLNSLKTVHH